MQYRTFKIKVRHDQGLTWMTVLADSEESAIERVMKTEQCPRSAIKKVERVHLPIKTIDIEYRTWLDRPNGNPYFSAHLIINYGMGFHKGEEHIPIRFQYGSPDMAKSVAAKILQDCKEASNAVNIGLTQWCRDNNVIFRIYGKADRLTAVKAWGGEQL